MTREDLGAGLVLVSEEIPEARSTAVGAWLRLGSRHERDQEHGYFHFLEHALFKGTRAYSAAGLARAIDGVGGQIDAFTSRDATAFYARVLPQHLDTAMELLGELLLRPKLAASAIETERGVILEELKMVEDNPEEHIHDLFMARFYPGHPLARPIAGTKTSIVQLRRAGLLQFFRARVAAPHLVVAIAGRFERQRVRRELRRWLEALSPNGDAGPELPAPATGSGVRVHPKDGLEQVHLCLGAPMPPICSERRFGAYLLNTVLGGSVSSRLFQSVREKLGLAYAIDSAIDLFQDSGCLTIYAGCSAAETGRVLEEILRQIRRLRHGGVSAEELALAQEHLKGSLALSQESTSARMAQLARHEIAFGGLSTLAEAFRAIDRTSREQLRELAQECLAPERLLLTVLCNGERRAPELPDLARAW
jgi:predicted Zn-dependent peptidase